MIKERLVMNEMMLVLVMQNKSVDIGVYRKLYSLLIVWRYRIELV